MSKYAGGTARRYALIAGFAEIGETLEETVKREVMEEVGLKVKNIQYYKSQPWSLSSSLLMGFYCDLDGSDHIIWKRMNCPKQNGLKGRTFPMMTMMSA